MALPPEQACPSLLSHDAHLWRDGSDPGSKACPGRNLSHPAEPSIRPTIRCPSVERHDTHLWNSPDHKKTYSVCPGRGADRAEAIGDTANAPPFGLQDLSEVASRLGPNARAIFEEVVPDVLLRFADASVHYGDANPSELGIRGQFADIWRKIGPLRRAMWYGETLTREQPREILMDLIGHCLLAIRLIDEQAKWGGCPTCRTILQPEAVPGGCDDRWHASNQ